jgi:hypothetical protein
MKKLDIEEKQDKTRKKLARDKLGRLLPNQESLNPEGRPPGSVSIVTRAKQILRDEPEKLEEVARDLLNNKKLRVELIRQIDGMPVARMKLGGEEGEPLVIITHEDNAK